MSSYIVSNKTYKNIKLLSYLIAKESIGDKEKLKQEINNGVFNLYKNNVASVSIQYGDKIRFISDEYYAKFNEEVLNIDFIEEYPYMNNNLAIDLFNALRYVNYQIEILYDDSFIKKIEHYILYYLSLHTDTQYPWGLDNLELKTDYERII